MSDDPVRYDPDRFCAALDKFNGDATSLTDGDIAQLRSIYTHLAERASARRAGYVEKTDPELNVPLSWNWFLKWLRDFEHPIAATHRHRIQEAHQRLETIEARLAAVEERPFSGKGVEWAGVWKHATFFAPGSLVTDKSGLWLAVRTPTDRPGRPDSGWRLVVKGTHRDLNDGENTP